MNSHLRPDDEVVTAYTSLRSRVIDLVRAQPAEVVDRRRVRRRAAELVATLVAGTPVPLPAAAVDE